MSRLFRTPSGPRDRLMMLAERQLFAIAAAKVTLPDAATPAALWTLTLSVSGWWLKSRSIEIDALMQRYAGIGFLFRLFDGVRALPGFAATASNATDTTDLQEAGQRFAEVVNEVGPDKLRMALGSSFFSDLQTKFLGDFPEIPDASAAQASRAVAGGSTVKAAARPVVEGRGVAAPPRKAVDTRAVSEQTVAFLSRLYPESIVKQILKG